MPSTPCRYFYVIMPVGSDPKYKYKKKLFFRLPGKVSAYLPNYSLDNHIFDFKATQRELQNADFVIADLSLERPSCYYEIGIAHTLDKRTYIVAKSGTEIHQTSQRESVTFYNELSELETILRDILDKESEGSLA